MEARSNHTVSVIIPARNEVCFLPALLRSLRAQSHTSLEIIIADGFSTDGTREYLLSEGWRYVDGGAPATGRNQGAMPAKGEILIFLDCDSVLPRKFIERNIAEFKERRLEIAVALGKPREGQIYAHVFQWVANCFLKATENYKPHGGGANGIFVTRDIWKNSEGFRQGAFFEDTEYIERVARNARFGVLRAEKIYISYRRFERDGRISTAKKLLISTTADMLGKKISMNNLKGGYDMERGFTRE
jgi:glycosyltransferase involved in cell wall biosynthesis